MLYLQKYFKTMEKLDLGNEEKAKGKRIYNRFVVLSVQKATLLGVFSSIKQVQKIVTSISPNYLMGETDGAKYQNLYRALAVCEYGNYIVLKVENSEFDTIRIFPLIENVLYRYSQVSFQFNEETAKQHE